MTDVDLVWPLGPQSCAPSDSCRPVDPPATVWVPKDGVYGRRQDSVRTYSVSSSCRLVFPREETYNCKNTYYPSQFIKIIW